MSCSFQQFARRRTLIPVRSASGSVTRLLAAVRPNGVPGSHGRSWRAATTVLQLLTLLLILVQMATAQTTAGLISGTVTDPQGAAVPEASVAALNQDQKRTVHTNADMAGQFVFPNLLPGRYTITVEAKGFKTLREVDVVLNANATVALGGLQLQIGTQVETVEVVAQGQEVQTDTAQRGDTLIGTQIEHIEVNGQSPLALLNLVPGVYETGSGVGAANINGNRFDSEHVMLNGATNMDTGYDNGWMAQISLDAVQEVTVLTSNYQAQYGRSAGAQINIVTKSGSSQFHGTGFEYFRDKGMNANTWTNNRVGTPRAAYHYNDAGFNIGGPVFVPHKFNKDRNKLFFFWDELWEHHTTASVNNVTMPTQAERNGDFSSSVDQSGKPVVIQDTSSGAPFPNNQIPASRLYKPGVALLNLFPLPNAIAASHPTYNYTSQGATANPHREDLVRADYNVTSKWRVYGSLMHSQTVTVGPYGTYGGSANFPLYNFGLPIHAYNFMLNATEIISPTAVNEIQFDQSYDYQHTGPVIGSNGWTATISGVTLPTLYPAYEDLIPGFTFNGTRIANSPTYSSSQEPFINHDTVTEVFDNLSIMRHAHTLKFGVSYGHNFKVQPSGANYPGTYNFGDSSINPLDAGFGFANAALGVFSSFTQASQYAQGDPDYNQFEFYAQDTWRATSRLTLDYGIRFYYMGPVYDGTGVLPNFFPQSWSAAQEPRLLYPALNASGTRIAVDTVTGQTYPSNFIGAYAPGTGNIQNGMMVLGKNGVDRGVTQNPGPLPMPRIGFAYDLTGRHTLVLRGGAGIFYNRTMTDPYSYLLADPPLTVQPTVLNGQASTLASSGAVLNPPTLNAFSNSPKVPTTYNYSLGIESRLPYSLLLNVSYVGSVSNHLLDTLNLNPVPFGAAFLPQNQDPTLQKASPNALAGTNALLSQFLRPYVGFNDITEYLFVGNSNYNSLQVSLNRRFASGLMLGVAYTRSRCMDTNDSFAAIRFDQYTHMAEYGPCGYDIPNNFVANYVYSVPKITSRLGFGNNRMAKAVLDDWQISGQTTFQSGTPFSPSFSVSGASGVNFTGTPSWGAIPLCVGNPTSGTTDSPYNRLNASAFALPAVGSIGLGCSRDILRGPGVNDFDMSLQKTVPFREKARLVLRGEAFNVFNHTQFSGINHSLTYSSITSTVPTNLPVNSSGALTNINGFGTVSGVRSARVLQLVAKFVF